MADVFVTGMAVLDLEFRLDEMPAGGDKFKVRDATVQGGGCAANATVGDLLVAQSRRARGLSTCCRQQMRFWWAPAGPPGPGNPSRSANSRGLRAIVDAPLSQADLIGANHILFLRPGLADLTSLRDLACGAGQVAAKTSASVRVTDGDAGAYFLQDGQITNVAVFDVDAIDTLAAGDIWHGVFAPVRPRARSGRRGCPPARFRVSA